MADIKISELTAVSSLNNGDLVEVSQVNELAPSGYTSLKASMADIGKKVNTDIEYTTDLADFTNKTTLGAIKETANLIPKTDNNLPHYTGTPTAGSTAEAIASKADKSGMFKIQSFSKTYSVGADSATNFDNSFITVPTGYTIAGVVGYTTNQDAVVAVSVRPAENSVWAFQLRKIYGSAVSGMTFSVTVLFVKSELVS